MGMEQRYSGVAATEAAAAGAVPVATSVNVASAADLGTGSDGLPTAWQMDSSTTRNHQNRSGSKSKNGSHVGPDGPSGDEVRDDGVTITWDKGEVQPSAFRDKWFAAIFVVHLLAVIVTAVVLDGPAAFRRAIADDAANADNTDDAQRGGDGNGDASSQPAPAPPPPPPEFWYSLAAIALVSAPALSLTALAVMAANAEALLVLSLWTSVVLCGVTAAVFLFVAPLAGIGYGFIAVLLFCYARSVRHKIPYAASNLKCGIGVIRTNLGLGVVAAGAMAGLVLYVVGWTLALVAALDLDGMKVDAAFGASGAAASNDADSHADGTTTDLSGLGTAVALLFLLSFYWTHQVLKNVVRTSVAGVVGTWWFSPLEAASFCSPAVVDSLLRSATYSLGSICFGSLIVAVLQLLRTILRSAADDNRGNGGNILRCIAVCILAYIEALVAYFNKWAYVYVGLYGYDYISAGKKVMGLFQTRGWSAIIADNLVNRLLGITSFAIGLLTGLCTLLGALLVEEFESSAVDKAGWLGIGFVLGFAVGLVLSGVVMGLLSSAVDSIIVCYAEAPDEFTENHPALATEMHRTWSDAWPDLNLSGPVVIGLGSGIGLV